MVFRLHLEYRAQIWVPQYKKKKSVNCRKFSRGPPQWSGLERLSCEKMLIDQGFSSLGERRLQGDLIPAFQYLRGGYQEDRGRLFPAVYSERTRDKGHKLKEEVQTGYMENLFHPEDSQARLQVAQRGCTVAIL